MYSLHMAVSHFTESEAPVDCQTPLFYVAVRKNTLWYTIKESLWSNSWYADRTPQGRVRGMKAKDRSRKTQIGGILYVIPVGMLSITGDVSDRLPSDQQNYGLL